MADLLTLNTLNHLCAAGLALLFALLLNYKPKIEETEMTNKFVQVVERIGEDVVKVVEFPFTEGAKIVSFIKAADKDAPAVIAAFDGLIAAGKNIGADATVELAADGTNFPEYLALAKDCVTFGKYFKTTFWPTIEKAFEDAKTATKVPDPAAPAAPASAVVAQPGPGLSTVVPQ